MHHGQSGTAQRLLLAGALALALLLVVLLLRYGH
jgi:hypothetical protein